MDLRAYQNGVRIDFSRPGKPTDNAHGESFNGTFRQACLNAPWFRTLSEAQESIEAWRRESNESRPHTALGHVPPAEFAAWDGGRSRHRTSLLHTCRNFFAS